MAISPIKIKIFGVDLFSSKMAKINKKIGNAGKKIGSFGRKMTLVASLPAVALGANILKSAGDFEQAMNTVSVVAREVGEKGIKDLGEEAKRLGISTQFSATQSANAMVELSKAGLNTTQVFKASQSVLELAGAGQIDMAESARLAAGTMAIFGKEAEDVTEIADVLTRGFTAAPTTVQELGTAITFGGNAANAMGLDLKDTAAILSAFAQQMEVGTLGGTKLRQVMTALAKPTSQAKAAFVKLGVGFTDVFKKGEDGKPVFKGMVNLIKQLENSNITLADSVSIFGQRAGPVMFKTIKKGSENLANLRRVMDDTGITAKKVSEAQLKGFNGQITKLISAFEGLKIAIADSGVLEFATKFAERLTEILQDLSKSNPALLRWGFILLILTAILGPLLILLGAVAVAVSAITLPFVLVALSIGAVVTALTMLMLKWKKVKEFFTGKRVLSGGGNEGLQRLGAVSGFINEPFGKGMASPLEQENLRLSAKSPLDDENLRLGESGQDKGLSNELSSGTKLDTLLNKLVNSTSSKNEKAAIDINFSDLPKGVEINTKGADEILNVTRGIMAGI